MSRQRGSVPCMRMPSAKILPAARRSIQIEATSRITATTVSQAATSVRINRAGNTVGAVGGSIASTRINVVSGLMNAKNDRARGSIGMKSKELRDEVLGSSIVAAIAAKNVNQKKNPSSATITSCPMSIGSTESDDRSTPRPSTPSTRLVTNPAREGKFEIEWRGQSLQIVGSEIRVAQTRIAHGRIEDRLQLSLPEPITRHDQHGAVHGVQDQHAVEVTVVDQTAERHFIAFVGGFDRHHVRRVECKDVRVEHDDAREVCLGAPRDDRHHNHVHQAADDPERKRHEQVLDLAEPAELPDRHGQDCAEIHRASSRSAAARSIACT